MVPGVPLTSSPSEPAYGRPISVEEWEGLGEDEPGELVDALFRELDEAIEAEAPPSSG